MQFKMKKIWIIRILLIILILFWMSAIFGFSSENGKESQSLSDKITINVIKIMNPEYKEFDVKEQEAYFNTVSFYVRKTGHFGEYAILGILVSLLLLTFENIRTKAKWFIIVIVTAGIWAMVYAVTDELHQGFVDGRSPKVLDVIIDTCGGMAGAVCIAIICSIVLRIRNNHNKLYTEEIE